MVPRALIHCLVFLVCGCGESSVNGQWGIAYMGAPRRTVQDLNALALEGARRSTAIVEIVLALDGAGDVWHVDGMLQNFVAGAVLAHKADGGGEDDLAALPRLHGSGCEAFARADPLDVVDDGYVRVAGEDEVAVHRVDGEVGFDRLLRSAQRLGNGGAAVDATGTRRMP